jgi:hypothetical protein
MHLSSLRHATHLHKQALQHNGWGFFWPSDQCLAGEQQFPCE